MNIPPDIQRIIMYYYQCSLRDKKIKTQVVKDIEIHTTDLRRMIDTCSETNVEWSRIIHIGISLVKDQWILTLRD